MWMMVNVVNVLVLLVFMGDMAVSLPSIQQKERNSLKPEALDNGAQESQQTNKKVLTMARWPYWPWSYWFGLQTFQSFPVSAETAIVLGGFNQRYRIEMWEAEDIGVPPLPFEFSYGFTFFTENKEIIIGDEDDIYSWKRPGSSWTKHEEPPENINRANAVLTSDGETVLVIPNAAQLEFSYLFSTAKGWQDGEFGGEARLGACLVSLADKKEVVFIGGGKDRGSATDKVEALSETGRFIRNLPNLRKERMWHGCSKARYNGRDGILVVGGSSRDSAKARLDSVEFLADDETAWEALRDLPYGVWAGVLRSVGGVLHLFGGVVTSHYDSTDKVLQFTESGSWQEVGKLEKNASAHGVVVIN